MQNKLRVAVTSRSFSSCQDLRNELDKQCAAVKYNDEGKKLEGKELVDFLLGCDAAIIGLEKIDETLLNSVPTLKIISKVGVGLDKIDRKALVKRKIKLSNTPGQNCRSVSELVICLMIASLRNIRQSNNDAISDNWSQYKGEQLSGKEIGIVGYGSIGKDLSSLLNGFGCSCLVFDINYPEDLMNSKHIVQTELNDLLVNSDIITIHLPLNENTRNLISAPQLATLKKKAIIINTARGGIVNEVDLYQFLLKNQDAKAAFDVFDVEPPVDKHLLNLPNFFATCHIGGSTKEAIIKMGRAAITGLETAVVPDEESIVI